MSGGIGALRGFDYQATVILDRLFDHFDQHGSTAIVRPEGIDDLDLEWTDADGSLRKRFEQIKKPREDQDGHPKPESWTLAEVAAEIVPNTITNLAGNAHQQVWILGDAVDPDVGDLVHAGTKAPTQARAAYWRLVHVLARNKTLKASNIGIEARRRIAHWKVPADLPPDPDGALSRLATTFGTAAEALGAEVLAAPYAASVRVFRDCLPDVLSRVEIRPRYGTEEDVAYRVRKRLQRQYGLDLRVVEATLFRNLRGFINDISKQPGRRFDREEFDEELRVVWPTMSPIRDVPTLDQDHIHRRDLADRFTTGFLGTAVEAVGVSGAGKTMLAAEVCQRSGATDPDRIVLYAEVQPDGGLRDTLAGVAFHLRRIGITQPFALAVDRSMANDAALKQLARALSATPRTLLLLIDLVGGSCSPAFSRDLAAFIAGLVPDACRIAVFGQESAFRDLTRLDRVRLGVGSIDIRGFDADEFALLASRRHPNPSRALLDAVFRRVTAGRAAGLHAKLARSLVDVSSLQAMQKLASMPAEDILSRAERERFSRLSPDSRPAAERLVCFALPFGRREAEEVFPNENIGAAVREMLDLGLLRPSGDETFEMHEIVRAGLEGMIAAGVRRSAHGTLATWYARLGSVAAEILHLEKAGRTSEANLRARDTFLRGERWPALAGLVTARGLVTPSEAIRAMVTPTTIEGCYLLPDVLHDLAQPFDVGELFAVARGQPSRFLSDYQWASVLAKTILAYEPSRLHELVVFCLELQGERDKRASVLSILLIEVRRRVCSIEPETVALFDTATADSKRLLVPLLLADGRRDTLQRAFDFIEHDVDRGRDDHGWRLSWHNGLSVDGQAAAVELLAALPDAPNDILLSQRSPLLGAVAPLLWRCRDHLRPHCINILREDDMAPDVQKAAIRVLVLFAEPRLRELCEALAERRDSAVHGFAALALSMAPALIDCEHERATLFDLDQRLERRSVALALLAAAGEELGVLYERLAATDQEHRAGWDFFFLQYAVQSPFRAAIPLVREHLRSLRPGNTMLFQHALTSLARLPCPEATAMLVEALSNRDRSVRMLAALALRGRRSRAALADLRRRLEVEDDPEIGVILAVAIVSSGAQGVGDLNAGQHASPNFALWRCVLAGRSRDAASASELVALARDRSASWQLRRAAISAAGSLPFEAALAHMLPILRERSPLASIDTQHALHTHFSLSLLLLHEGPALLPVFVGSRNRFAALVAGILDDSRLDIFNPNGSPDGAQVGEWLYDQLIGHGWPHNSAALDAVIGELHIPLLHSAILRGLCRARRTDLIEAELARAEHVWIATKCLLFCARAERPGQDLAARLTGIVGCSPMAGHPYLERVIAEIASAGRVTQPAAAAVTLSDARREPERALFGYEEAVLILNGDAASIDLKARAPLVFAPLTCEQFRHLARLSDPANDQYPVVESYFPQITFHPEGHTVAQRQHTYPGASEPPGAWTRPALAAANAFGLSIRWHDELLSGPYPDTYAGRLFDCLSARRDQDAFYELLYRDPHLLLPHLCQRALYGQVADLMCDRIVPFLTMHLSSGTEEIFAGLCALTRSIDTPAIDRVLSGLFQRWTRYFNLRSARGPNEASTSIWKAFRSLTSHPRFEYVEGWQILLWPVLHVPIAWYHRQDVARVLERDPRSYASIEALLFKEEDWEHYLHDEINHLENAAERLFDQTAE